MNGKKAKLLRRMSAYHPAQPRVYTHTNEKRTSSGVVNSTMILNTKGSTRKFYQAMKRGK